MKDRTDIKPGDVITWCEEEYTVIENFGDRGIVKDGGGEILGNFYWNYDGERSITEEEKFLNKGW